MLANLLTFFRLLSTFVIVYFIKVDNFLYANILFILASFTDYLDGYVARNFDQETFIGKFLDPLADKILFLSVMFSFVEKGFVSSLPLSLILTREFITLGLGSVVVINNGDIFIGKVKNLFHFLSVFIILIFKESLISDIFIWISVFFSLFSGLYMYFSNIDKINNFMKEKL